MVQSKPRLTNHANEVPCRPGTWVNLSGGGVLPLLLAALGALVLAACQMTLPLQGGRSPTELAEATTEWRIVPTSRAYVNAPQALVVLERNLGSATEQRITLPNDTSLAGENVILLRAQTSRSASTSRFVLADALVQFGGAPTPFTGLSDGGLSSTSDGYGDITYATRALGGDVTCVLAFRRTEIGSRALPRGTSSLDMMLRNCVRGSGAAALAPVGATAFGLGGGF